MGFAVKFELFVASRYLRAKRRQAVIGVITALSVIGVAAGVGCLIIALSINAGFQRDLQNQLLGSTAHVQLQLLQTATGIENWRTLLPRLAKQPHVVAAAPVLYDEVMVSRGSRASGMLLKGVIPEYENRVSDLLKSVKIGSAEALAPAPAPTPCPKERVETDCAKNLEVLPIVIGKDLAETIGANLGSTINVTSPQGELTPFGPIPKFDRFKVVGIFSSGFYNYDSSWGFIRLADAQRLASVQDVISVIDFRIDDLYKAEQVGHELQEAAGPGYQATSWMDQNRALFRALSLEKLATFLIISLIVLVAALNILISLIMMVMEKTKDIAVLLSMGARRRQVRWVFVCQGVLIGVIGTTLGLIIGYSVALAGAKYHFIHLSSEVYSIDYLPFAPSLSEGIWVSVWALFISLVATLYPSWSAARVLPAEALRYE
jgi:lipoprotein-releasing system permease protein